MLRPPGLAKVRVLLAIDGMHPRDGGPPRVVAGSARALQARGHEVAVMTAARPGDVDAVRSTCQAMLDAGVELHFVPQPGVLSLFSASHPGSEIRALIEQADVVHLHALWSPMMASVAHHAIRAGVPYFVSTHGLLDRRAMWMTPFKRLKKQAFIELAGVRQILGKARGVIFGSDAEAGESLELTRSMKRISIPNGVASDLRRVPLTPGQHDLLTKIAPQFTDWNRSLLYFSRINPEKGLDMLVTAFNAVAPDFPGAGLLIAGIRQDDNYLAQVNRLIEEGGCRDRIVLTTELTGPKSQFLHSLCDIFVLPSHAEGFSVAMVEALAHGMPCLLTQYCHAPLVASEGAGVVVPPSPEGIESGLRSLLALPPDRLAAMGARARALFEERYTWDRVAESLEEAYGSSVSNLGRWHG